MDLGFDDCMDRALADTLVEEFGCGLPYIPASKETSQICQGQSRIEAFKRKDSSVSSDSSVSLTLATPPAEKVLQYMSFSCRYKYLSSSGQRRLCPRPCSDIEVFTGLPFKSRYRNKDRGYLKVYLKSTTKARGRMTLIR